MILCVCVCACVCACMSVSVCMPTHMFVFVLFQEIKIKEGSVVLLTASSIAEVRRT